MLHGLALVGASTPNFFVAAMLVIVFSVWLGMVPTFGVAGLTSFGCCPGSPSRSSRLRCWRAWCE